MDETDEHPAHRFPMERLREAPDHRVVVEDGDIRGVTYENEPSQGRPTEVFAWVGVPRDDAPAPAMVCVHGGGGKAFREWVEAWVGRGYAAVSMDLGGCGPEGERHETAGPRQDHAAKFGVERGWEETWTYHAACAVVRAHSLLAADDGVDAGRVGLTGISWGGYLTCVVAGIDDRFRFAVPVYGCGHLQHNSAEDWQTIFAEMSNDDRVWWHDHCDPAVYLPHVSCPVLWVTGTNDFAYPLDSLKLSDEQLAGDSSLCVRHEMAHGHEPGWAPVEIELFAEHHLRDGDALPAMGAVSVAGKKVRAPYRSSHPVVRAELLYTTDRGRWQERTWQVHEAHFDAVSVSATVPEEASVFYLGLEDERGCWVNTPHVER